jgi:hypothetical protein
MVADLQKRVAELRYIGGIEKVEHVCYPSGDEFWVRFDRRLEIKRLEAIARSHGATMVKFGGLPSKLPRPLAELLWDGVKYVIAKKPNGWTEFTASLGFEPDGIARIAADAHGPYEIFIATQEEGVQILYEYLGLKYVAPAAPTKVVTPPKPPTVTVPKPAAPASRPGVPAAGPVSTPSPTAKPAQVASVPPPQPAVTVQAIPKDQYRPHAWGQTLTNSEPKPTPTKAAEEKKSENQSS